MTSNLNLLLVEDSRDILRTAKSTFEAKGYSVDTCQRDGIQVLKHFADNNYDAIILDAVMSNYDAVAVIRAIKTDRLRSKPAIIVTSNFDNGIIGREIVEAGADYFVLKPFDLDTLCERVEMLTSKRFGIIRKAERLPLCDVDLEVMVSNMLFEVGVGANLSGYRYLRSAIILVINDNAVINRMTKEVYPTVAKEHGSTAARVERSIRTAIESAWDRGDVDTLNSYFGYTIQKQKGKPTNSEFIALLADKISLKIKAG